MKEGLTDRFDIDQLVRKNVLGLTPYSSARDEYTSDGNEMVFLDANENPYENGVNRYPDPQQRDLKAVLAQQKGLESNNILLGNGSDEVLDLIFRAFCEPGKDNIITLPPTYGMYKVLAGVNDVQNKEVGLNLNFEPDTKKVFEATDENTKIIFLCSPNNPTANSFSSEAVTQIVKNFSGLVVIDEAYIDFSQQQSQLRNLKDSPNLIITQTLSKAYGMAGIRLGVCYSSPEIIEILNKVKPPYNVNELTQKRALSRVLEQQAVKEEVDRILTERKKLEGHLRQLSYVAEVFPSDANFILVRVDDAQTKYSQLLNSGIVVRNRSSQYRCENTLRFTVGTAEENNKLIQTLKELE